MIKLLVFCALALFASSNQLTWTGNWYVLSQYSINEGKINLPRNGTIVSFTTNPTGIAVINGVQNDNTNITLNLPWQTTDTTGSVCSFDYCTNGTIAQVNGVVYANISIGYSTNFYSILLTPCDVNWLGRWFVTSSIAYDPYGVTVPEPFTYVDIEIVSGGEMKMTGNDGSLVEATWPLLWDPATTNFANICGYIAEYTYVCANGNVTLEDWYLYATIEWTPASPTESVIELVRLPPSVPTDVDLFNTNDSEDLTLEIIS